MKKIAIASVETETRKELTQALGYLTGFDIVRPAAYSSKAIKYGLNKELRKCNWQELYIYVLSSFSERIKIEQNFENFISNGSVLNELAQMYAAIETYSKDNREGRAQKLIFSSLDRIISKYTTNTYDCILFIEKEYTDDELYVQLRKCFLSLFEKCKIKYFVLEDKNLIDMLEEVNSLLSLEQIITTQTALKKVQLTY